MRCANKAIIRQRYPIPTVDDVLHNMNGSMVFSKLELKWGYHQLELTPESRDITTFATHRGVYRYKRLLFGVSSASELYQHEVSTVLAGIEGVQNISDDVIVHGPTQKIHDQWLHAVLKRLRDRGLTLNQKCQFNMSKLVFMGIMLSEKGIGPTKERVRALVQAKGPQNQSEVRSFLGIANYSAWFIPQFSTLTEPLRVQLKKDVPFKFGPQQKKPSEQLKAAMAKANTLAFFVKDATTKVVADASPIGLGAVLLQEQNGREVPVCYASRSPDSLWTALFPNRKGGIISCMGLWKIPCLPIWKEIWTCHRSQAAWGYLQSAIPTKCQDWEMGIAIAALWLSSGARTRS